tara:strand:+ start:637 stop:1158 length:522 start_codon:yes stop_codon:yes gene_type:complete
MGIITPTFSLKANAGTASSSAGPMSMALALSLSDSLSVSKVDHFVVNDVPHGTLNWTNVNVWDRAKLIDGSADHPDGGNAESTTSQLDGCWVLIINTTAVTSTELIHIGYTNDADASADGHTYTTIGGANDGERLFTLKAGEFAWFPFDFTGDLYCSATAASQTLEFWRFNRT